MTGPDKTTPEGEIAQDVAETHVAEAPASGAPEPVSEPEVAPTPEPVIVELSEPERPEPPPAPPAAEPPAPEPVAAPRRRGMGVALGLVIGGVLAAAIGFAAARYVVPGGWPFPGDTARFTALEDRLAAQDRAVEALRADLSGLAGMGAALDDLRAAQTDLGARLDAAAARLEEVAARPVSTVPPEDLAALRAEVARLQGQLDQLGTGDVEETIAAMKAAAEEERRAAEARLAAAEAEAQARAQAALARAAVLRAQAALDTGTSLAEPLADLAAAGVALPPALAEGADVPTLPQLQEEFPEAARAALAAVAKVEPDAPLGDRIGAFLRAQTGARSLTPRAGDDPDAVLSRAEAALRAGDLAGAVAGLDPLPAEATAEMAAWRARAESRLAVAAALSGLAGN
ncbi:COG4223 family protein [Ruixingdingia sedimenti]|uniref:Inner membrane protein n=1 Tax=Ruixingdingia sedimenti TaxID=3073604 RepID=A0ABU1F6H8_9RHOB|nr:hypothetical protein [Xinfangfangia sp. LG-4]MDR5652481.1 hypothetical protein [Xinfangfangia sp. LG-4]